MSFICPLTDVRIALRIGFRGLCSVEFKACCGIRSATSSYSACQYSDKPVTGSRKDAYKENRDFLAERGQLKYSKSTKLVYSAISSCHLHRMDGVGRSESIQLSGQLAATTKIFAQYQCNACDGSKSAKIIPQTAVLTQYCRCHIYINQLAGSKVSISIGYGIIKAGCGHVTGYS